MQVHAMMPVRSLMSGAVFRVSHQDTAEYVSHETESLGLLGSLVEVPFGAILPPC